MTESILNCMQEHLFEHFNSMRHNVSITIIDKADGKNFKKGEDYCRRTLKTYSLFGLNVKDSA